MVSVIFRDTVSANKALFNGTPHIKSIVRRFERGQRHLCSAYFNSCTNRVVAFFQSNIRSLVMALSACFGYLLNRNKCKTSNFELNTSLWFKGKKFY